MRAELHADVIASGSAELSIYTRGGKAARACAGRLHPFAGQCLNTGVVMLQVLEALQRGAAHESLVCCAAYLLGEYGRQVEQVPLRDQFTLLQERFVTVSSEAKVSNLDGKRRTLLLTCGSLSPFEKSLIIRLVSNSTRSVAEQGAVTPSG